MEGLNFAEYIKPEMLVLVPVIYLIGTWLKQLERIKDNFIPLILGGVGVVFAVLYIMATADWDAINIFMVLFTALVQGVLCAGAAVYGHQVIKQLGAGSGAK